MTRQQALQELYQYELELDNLREEYEIAKGLGKYNETQYLQHQIAILNAEVADIYEMGWRA